MTEHEFDVVMTVRRRVVVKGPATREAAEKVLRTSLENGISVFRFARLGDDMQPSETVLSEIKIADPDVEQMFIRPDSPRLVRGVSG